MTERQVRRTKALTLCLLVAIAVIPLMTMTSATSPEVYGATMPKFVVNDHWYYNFGNNTTYQLTVNHTNIQVNGTDTVELRVLTTVKTQMGNQIVNGRQWLRTSDMAMMKSMSNMTMSVSGYTIKSSMTAYFEPPQQLQKFPMTIGLNWSGSTKMTDTSVSVTPFGTTNRTDSTVLNLTFEVLGKESVTSPAGTFDALKYVGFSDGKDPHYFYYSWEVGNIVKVVGADNKVDQELTSFQCADPGKWARISGGNGGGGGGNNDWGWSYFEGMGRVFYLYIMANGIIWGLIIGAIIGAVSGYVAKLPRPVQKEGVTTGQGPSGAAPVLGPREMGLEDRGKEAPLTGQYAAGAGVGGATTSLDTPAVAEARPKKKKRYCPLHGCRTEEKDGEEHCPECQGKVTKEARERPKYCPKHGCKAEDKAGDAWCPECDAAIVRRVKYCPQHGCRTEDKDGGPWCPECNGPIAKKRTFCSAHGCKYEYKGGIPICPECQEEGEA